MNIYFLQKFEKIALLKIEKS